MKKLLSLLLLMISVTVMAQSRLHKGNSTYTSDILYTWDGKYLYKGNSTYASDILYTWDGKCLYKGRSTYMSDILFTISGKIPLPVLSVVL